MINIRDFGGLTFRNYIIITDLNTYINTGDELYYRRIFEFIYIYIYVSNTTLRFVCIRDDGRNVRWWRGFWYYLKNDAGGDGSAVNGVCIGPLYRFKIGKSRRDGHSAALNICTYKTQNTRKKNVYGVGTTACVYRRAYAYPAISTIGSPSERPWRIPAEALL